jgi:quercetin dioxygenase-like cupin family protein
MKFVSIVMMCWLMAGVCAGQKKKAQPAAAPGEVEITAEPHHRMIYQNEYVRVFDVTIMPKDATQMHVHRHDYIFVALGAAQISNEVKGKPAVQLALTDGEVRFAEGGFAHVVRNVGATPFRNIAVEFLQDAKMRNAPAGKWNDENAVQVQGGQEQVAFVKDGVRVATVQIETAGFEKRHHHDGPQLVIALNDMTLRSDSPEKGPMNLEMKAGQVRWIDGDLTHSVTNVGTQAARFVSVEF